MSDPRDLNSFASSDLISMGFIHTPGLMALVEETRQVSEIDTDRFDAILVAGGQAPMSASRTPSTSTPSLSSSTSQE